MKLAVPDMISNSYFPALAAVELGCFAREGLDVELELISPTDLTYQALRDGQVDFVGAEAHAALAVFPRWDGVKLLCAQAQHTYWFLVMRPEFAEKRGDLDVVRGRRIGAAPFVDLAFKHILKVAGYDLVRDDITIMPIAEVLNPKINIGIALAQAMEDGRVDGFWANGMGAEIAVRRGVGTVVLDVRRGDGPPSCRDITFAAIATSQRLIDETPDHAAAAVRAIGAALAQLQADPSRAAQVGRKLFPQTQADLIEDLVRRDLPYYASVIAPETVAALNGFARDAGLTDRDAAYEHVVATQFSALWRR